MLSLLAAIAIGQTNEGYSMRRISLVEPNNKPVRLQIWIRDGRLDPAKLSPKQFGDPPCGALHVVLELGIAVEILPPFSDLALELGDAIDDGHALPAAKGLMCRFAPESVNP